MLKKKKRLIYGLSYVKLKHPDDGVNSDERVNNFPNGGF